MRRQNRLQAAKHWIPTYNGKNIVKEYCNWFGVDLLCAIKELKILGIQLDEQYINQALKSRERMIAMKRENKKHELEEVQLNSDENFYFIAGYTSGGFPYGLTWEEAAELEIENNI